MKVTRLESFLKANRLRAAHLAREARVSPSYVSGRREPTRPMMLAIRDTCSRILGRTVHLSELFDLGDSPSVITLAHGYRFAEEWYRAQIEDAFDASGIMPWPENGTDAEQDRFHDLTDEACMLIFYSVRTAIAEAFVKVASEVLARERSR